MSAEKPAPPSKWWDSVIHNIVWALNGAETRVEFAVPTPKQLDDDSLQGLGTNATRAIWCGGERERSIVFVNIQPPANDELATERVVIHYRIHEKFISFSVPCLSMGEVAALRAELPKVRCGSHDSTPAPHQLILGLRELHWANLYERFLKSKDAEIKIAIGGVIKAGDLYVKEQKDSFRLSEAETYDVKMCSGTKLLLHEFNSTAWSVEANHRAPTLPKLIASATASTSRAPQSRQNEHEFSASEACLVFGIPEGKAIAAGRVIGVELEFSEFDLGETCHIFPPLLPAEVRAIKYPVQISETRTVLERYCGRESAEKVIQLEGGLAWRAEDRNNDSVILRYRNQTDENTVEDENVDNGLPGPDVESSWQLVDNTEEYPEELWKERFVLRLMVRPSPELEGIFFSDSTGFVTSAKSHLSCFGVWLRLRPQYWEDYFKFGNALRLQIGNCFLGETPPHFITQSFSRNFDREEFALTLMAASTSAPRIFAVELDAVSSLVTKSWFDTEDLKNNPITVVLFVPLDNVQDRCQSLHDRSFAQLTDIQHAIRRLELFNVVDVVPILPCRFSAERPVEDSSRRLPFISESSLRKLARDYFERKRVDQGIPPQLLTHQSSFVVWTTTMDRIYSRFQRFKTQKHHHDVMGLAGHGSGCGMTTTLSFVSNRLWQDGVRTILCRDGRSLVAELRTLRRSSETDILAVFLDWFIEDTADILSEVERHWNGRSFIVCSVPVGKGQCDVTPVWELDKLRELVPVLLRAYDSVSEDPSLETRESLSNIELRLDEIGASPLSVALGELLKYCENHAEACHVFLFVFVATHGEFIPVPDLIRNVLKEVEDHIHDPAIFRTVICAVAFVSAVGPTDSGLPYTPTYMKLLKRTWVSKVVKVKEILWEGIVEYRMVYIHPYFARVHLILLANASASKFDVPFPAPREVCKLWRSISSMLKNCIPDDRQDHFFGTLFAKRNFLAPLALHFIDNKQGGLYLDMCEGYLKKLHFHVLASKIYREEQNYPNWATNTLRHASLAYDSEESYMTAHNYASSVGKVHKNMNIPGKAVRDHLESRKAENLFELGMRLFEMALEHRDGNADRAEQQRKSVVNQMAEYFYKDIMDDKNGGYREWRVHVNSAKKNASSWNTTLNEGQLAIIRLWRT